MAMWAKSVDASLCAAERLLPNDGCERIIPRLVYPQGLELVFRLQVKGRARDASVVPNNTAALYLMNGVAVSLWRWPTGLTCTAARECSSGLTVMRPFATSHGSVQLRLPNR